MNLWNLNILFLLILHCHCKQQYFTEQPKDVIAVSGDRIVLPCQVESKQGLLQWTKDGFGLGVDRELPGYSTYSMVGDEETGEWSLLISSVTIGDDATYQCQVTAAGSSNPIRSQPAHLTVMVPPGKPHILQGDVVEAIDGDEIILECKTSGGRPAAEIVWKDESGNEILTNTIMKTKKLSDMKTFETSSVLRMWTGLEDDRKKIFCSAQSDISSKTIDAMTVLRLRYAPRVKLVYKEEAVNEGNSIKFECKVEAYPEQVAFAWYLNGVELAHEQKSTMMIEKVERHHDNAQIECEASNSMGTTKTDASIKVKYAPSISRHPESLKAKEGSTVHLSCYAEGSPAPRYMWSRGSSDEVIGFSKDLILVATDQTAGDYKCTAVVEGFPPARSQPARLSLVTKPLIISKKEQFGRLGARSRLECKVKSSANNKSISWDKNGVPIVSNGGKYEVRITDDNNEQTSELFIEDSQGSDFSKYGCKADNELGSDYLQITLEEEVILNLEVLYIVIGIFAIVILILMSILCVIICRRRNKANLKLIETANEKSKRRELLEDPYASTTNEIDDKNMSEEEGKLCGPGPDLIMPLMKYHYNPASNEDNLPDVDIQKHPTYILTPFEDEKPYMIQRFENQPLQNSASLSSIESDPFSASLCSNNMKNMSPMDIMSDRKLQEFGKSFRIKTTCANERSPLYAISSKNAKSDLTYTLDDGSDDQYVTLLPSAHPAI